VPSRSLPAAPDDPPLGDFERENLALLREARSWLRREMADAGQR